MNESPIVASQLVRGCQEIAISIVGQNRNNVGDCCSEDRTEAGVVDD